mmetsp:Transcript_38284/g.120531  ORF Transcript_38284/g.120531 Transcript_38284/m.120531 type:complete len:305 (+) Transcript_38284:13-927(+)
MPFNDLGYQSLRSSSPMMCGLSSESESDDSCLLFFVSLLFSPPLVFPVLVVPFPAAPSRVCGACSLPSFHPTSSPYSESFSSSESDKNPSSNAPASMLCISPASLSSSAFFFASCCFFISSSLCLCSRSFCRASASSSSSSCFLWCVAACSFFGSSSNTLFIAAVVVAVAAAAATTLPTFTFSLASASSSDSSLPSPSPSPRVFSSPSSSESSPRTCTCCCTSSSELKKLSSIFPVLKEATSLPRSGALASMRGGRMSFSMGTIFAFGVAWSAFLSAAASCCSAWIRAACCIAICAPPMFHWRQ